MKKIQIISLVSALLVFMVSFLMFSGRNNSESQKSENVHMKRVVVAVRHIPPNTLITAEMLKVQEVPLLESDRDFYEKVEDVAGVLLSTADIFPDEKISSLRALKADAVYGLSYYVEKGMRAISFTLTKEQGIGGNLKVGDYVDVLFSSSLNVGEVNGIETPAGIGFDSLIDPRSPANTTVYRNNVDRKFATTLLENIKVLALDRVIKYIPADASQTGNSETVIYEEVTLQVTPQQARQLVLVSYGKPQETTGIHLSLRAAGDKDILNTPRDEIYREFSDEAPIEAQGGESSSDSVAGAIGAADSSAQTETTGAEGNASGQSPAQGSNGGDAIR